MAFPPAEIFPTFIPLPISAAWSIIAEDLGSLKSWASRLHRTDRRTDLQMLKHLSSSSALPVFHAVERNEGENYSLKGGMKESFVQADSTSYEIRRSGLMASKKVRR
jgi:hypothetical protein